MKMLATRMLLFACLFVAASAAARSTSRNAGNEVPPSPEDGGPRHWEVTGISSGLNLREQPSTSAKIILRYPSGAILANLGCRRMNDRIWCDVQKLGGGARGYVSLQYLTPAIAPDGSVPAGPDDSAIRAGQGKFDATGKIPCTQYRGQPMGQCEFGVARAGGGYATVSVNRPDGKKRSLYFVRGEFLGADTSQADGYQAVANQKQNGLHLISVGDERYEIPDALIFGS